MKSQGIAALSVQLHFRWDTGMSPSHGTLQPHLDFKVSQRMGLGAISPPRAPFKFTPVPVENRHADDGV